VSSKPQKVLNLARSAPQPNEDFTTEFTEATEVFSVFSVVKSSSHAEKKLVTRRLSSLCVGELLATENTETQLIQSDRKDENLRG
jgi:hypothetical protein